MNTRIRIGISACLLGENVRYDGGNSLDKLLKNTFGRYVEWIPVCPEVECGFAVPREPMILYGNKEEPRLITRYSKIDYTEKFISWVLKKLKEIESLSLSGFIFKSRSPSCGLYDTKIYGDNGEIVKGSGIFASNLFKRFPFLPVQSSSAIYRRSKMEEFFRYVSLYNNWRDLIISRSPEIS